MTARERASVENTTSPWPVRVAASNPAVIVETGARLAAATAQNSASERDSLADDPPVREPRVLPAGEEILTPEDVARHLAIPKKTVIALCADGRLVGAFKAGRRWRIPGHAVRRMATGER